MNQLDNIINVIPQLQEQITLFDKVFFSENMHSKENRKMVAWVASIAMKGNFVITFIKEKSGELSQSERAQLLLPVVGWPLQTKFYGSQCWWKSRFFKHDTISTVGYKR